MKSYIKYRLKRLRIPMILMLCTVLVVCSGIISGKASMYGDKIAGSTFFIKNLTDTLGRTFLIFIILSACLGFSSMTYCISDTEKALPYKSGTRYLISYFSGFLFMSISFLLISLSAVFHYVNNYTDYSEINMMSSYYTEICRLDSLGNGLMFIFNIFLVCLAVYTVFGMAAIITEYGLLSVLVAIGILVFPEFLVIVLNMISNLFVENIWNLFGIMDVTRVSEWFSEIEMEDKIIYIGDRTSNCLGMFIITAVSYIIGYMAVKNIDNTSGRFTISVLFDRYIIFMSGLYIAFLIPLMDFLNGKPVYIVVLLMAAVFLIIEIFMMKSLSKGKKYDYLNPGGDLNE
ncbi:MAG: hypothetical protein K2M78_17595 [Lachnospiraceae bacterium]|nr:hypothetical protein [Lachnospiraceae bacterium]